MKVHLHYSSKIKVNKKSRNSRNPGFSYYIFLLDDGKDLVSDPKIFRSYGIGSGTLDNIPYIFFLYQARFGLGLVSDLDSLTTNMIGDAVLWVSYP